MSTLDFIQIVSSFGGIAVALLMILFRRIRKASWALALFLIVASLAPAALSLPVVRSDWSNDAALRICFCILVLAAPIGAVASYAIGRADFLQLWRKSRILSAMGSAAAPVGIFWVYLHAIRPDPQLEQAEGALGPGGYFCALYLVLISIFVLAILEQTLRSAQEHVRWELKFVLLGMGAVYATLIYISSKVLLFAPSIGLVSLPSLRTFPLVFLIACLLILVSWRRSTGRSRVTVSPGLVYSSITLVCVGIYLIISSLAARWAARWSGSEISVEAVLFLFLLLGLAVVLLWADFRHRAKYWIRRNLLAGNYDYRLFWLEASERVRSIDPPEVAAEALADIVQKAIGAIDISIWLRRQDPLRLGLIGMRGEVRCAAGEEVLGVVEELFDLEKPTQVTSMGEGISSEPMKSFLARTQASVLVPLQSGSRVVGLLTVGPDRSGRPYDWDALEFLGVLGNHAAGELHKTDLLSRLVEAKESEVFRTFSTFLLHDLKNFASTLSLIAKNASRYQENPDFQRDAFQSVFQTAEKMKRLCNSLRTFSGAVADKKLSNLNHIVRIVADNFSGDLGDCLVVDLADVPSIFIDSEEIERVLRNLVLNAREAIAPQGRIIVRTRLHEGQVELSVEDNGCGMKREYVDKELFVPFHTTKSDGLGIGLYQCKKIVEAHQGKIKVDSEEGLGTAIRLSFPIANTQQEESPEIPKSLRADNRSK